MFDHTLTESEITRRLTATYRSDEIDYTAEWLTTLSHPTEPLRAAAVLIPLLVSEGEWHTLYTHRTDTVANHKSQVAFPGGSRDPEDVSLEATALREAHEEIGLDPRDVRILGRLTELPTVTNYYVAPVIGVIPWPYPLRIEENEVNRVFTIPLNWLSNPAHWEVRQHKLPGRSETYPVIFFQPYDNELLWGVSAQITVNLMRVLTDQAYG
jgi:8-oxo-dGTP pyrophosphatase MutT (NUDIX family)